MANAVQFQVVSTGARRVVKSAHSGRPSLRSPQAHPDRPVAPGRVAVASSCAAVTKPVRPSAWLQVKVAAVALLAVVGAGVSVQQFAAMTQPDPAVTYVAGDPGWAHVNP